MIALCLFNEHMGHICSGLSLRGLTNTMTSADWTFFITVTQNVFVITQKLKDRLDVTLGCLIWWLAVLFMAERDDLDDF